MQSLRCRTCSTANPIATAPAGMRWSVHPEARWTEQQMTDRWSEADANAWWRARSWLCGFNFLPSTAVNFIEMWHRDSFDAATIERELGWAAGLGFNAFRINLHYLVWKHDRDGLLDRLDRVMGMGAVGGHRRDPRPFRRLRLRRVRAGIWPPARPCAGCAQQSGRSEPRARNALNDGAERDGFERYVADIVARFRTDQRVAFWDLYNEPGNRMIFGPSGADLYLPDFSEQSLCLMRELALPWRAIRIRANPSP
jgi:hypothetical protein